VSRYGPWKILDIEPTGDRTAIRRAYAARLRHTNPEDDAAGFQALREAYEQALRFAAHAEWQAAAEAEEAAQAEEGGEVVAADVAPLPEPAPLEATPEPQPAEAVAEAQPAPEEPFGQVSRAEIQALEQELRLLAEAIHGETPDAEAAEAAFERVMGLPAMDSMSVRDQVERHVAGMVLHAHTRAATEVMYAAAEAFGWSSQRLGVNSELAAAVEARRADSEFLARVRRYDSDWHSAVRALSVKPTWARQLGYRVTLNLGRRVRELLDEIDRGRATLLAEFDADALRWWRNYLDKPQLAPSLLWALVFVPPIVAFAAGPDTPGTEPELLGWWAGIAALMTAACAAWIIGLGHARRAWLEHRTYRAGVWERLGWVPLLLANLAAAGAVPSGVDLQWLFALIALAGAVWARVAAEAEDTPWVDMVWRLPTAWLPIFQIPARTPLWLTRLLGLLTLVVFWSCLSDEISDAARLCIQWPLIGAVVGFVVGHHNLEAAWRRSPDRARIIALSVFAGLAAGLPFWLWATAPGPAYAALAGATVTGMVLLERVVSLGADRRKLRDAIYHWGWLPALGVADMVDEQTRQGNSMLLILGIWLLAGAAAGIIGALRREREAQFVAA